MKDWRTRPIDKLSENDRDARLVYDAGVTGYTPAYNAATKHPEKNGIMRTLRVRRILSPDALRKVSKKKPCRIYTRLKDIDFAAFERAYDASRFDSKADYAENAVMKQVRQDLKRLEKKSAPNADTLEAV